MKLNALILFIAIFTLTSFKTDNKKIIGTWKIISEENIINGNRTLIIKDENNSGLKTWSNDYYMFVSKAVRGSQISQTFGGGRYELSGNKYTESNDYHVAPNFRGREMKLYLEIKGDTLMQIYPCDDNFNYDINNCNIQKYIKLD